MLMKLSAVALFLASSAVAFPSFGYTEKLAPIITAAEADVIPDSYFVVFKNGVRANDHSAWVHNLHKRDMSVNGIWDNITSGVKHVYDMGEFQGIAGRFRPDVLDEIRKNPDEATLKIPDVTWAILGSILCSLPNQASAFYVFQVDYIERDQVVYASETQRNAPWGLARISHRKRLTLGTFNKYEYDPNGGNGVTVFVIDTGVNVDHKEFGGRATWGKTIPSGDPDQDDNGHGTHCAGTIGSAAFGVSKKAEIVAVKVLRSNGSGSMADVVAGVDFAVSSHLELKAQKGKKYKGSVANMSLGGGKSRPLDAAVANAVTSGLHFAVAAGNDNRDACDYSPAGVETAITVGASSLDDSRAYFSNHGPCNASAFHTGALTPQEMKDYLIARATRDVLTDIPAKTPNLLIYNDIVSDQFFAW
ncbi:serine protease [Podila horticola]|nr:serine protease [Podila horticola]